MPSNNSKVIELNQRFPGRVGWLMNPRSKRKARGLPWGIDNDCYAAWVQSGRSIRESDQFALWDAGRFRGYLSWAAEQLTRPEWVVVPDVVGSRVGTLRRFDKWAPVVSGFGFRLAMAVQDGMKPNDVPADVVAFVGGTTEWKWSNVERFAAECETSHVGRVNGYSWLWYCHESGVDSVDGTGFFRGDQKQLRGLLRYLEESNATDSRPDRQLRLPFVET